MDPATAASALAGSDEPPRVEGLSMVAVLEADAAALLVVERGDHLHLARCGRQKLSAHRRGATRSDHRRGRIPNVHRRGIAVHRHLGVRSSAS